MCFDVMTSKRTVWRIWAGCRAWQLGPHDTSKCPRRCNRQTIEAQPQSYKVPLWAWPQLASVAPPGQPLASRVNRVASTPAMPQTHSVWPELQGLDLKLSTVWCSSYLWPKRRATVRVLSHFQLCSPVNCSPPGSSVHGTLQARILGWVARPSCRGPSRPRDRTRTFGSSCIVGRVLSHSATWETHRRAGLPLTSLSPSFVRNRLSACH